MDSEQEGQNRGLRLSVSVWWVGATQLPDSGSTAYLLPGGGAGGGPGTSGGKGGEGQSLS